MQKIKLVEHLYEIYPSMPRYANDPEESEVVKTYDFILRRFQGFYGQQPTYFVKAAASPILIGDEHDYSGFPYFSFSSTQDVIIAIAKSSSSKIRINNYQSAIYGEKVIQSSAGLWKFDEKGDQDRFKNAFTKILTIVAEELNCKDFGGLDILIYTGFVEDEFMGWKENLFATFYSALVMVLSKKEVDSKSIANVINKLLTIDNELGLKPQLTNYRVGYFTQHNSEKPNEIAFPQGLQIVIAHSMTPLPKKLIQGKRFNLRRCEILIAIEYMKIVAGTGKQKFINAGQLREVIGCTTEELIQEIEENIPKGKLSAEEIEQFTEQSLIDILKEVPFANNVIDQNNQYFPRDRALFFLKEELLLHQLTPQNLIQTVQESHKNQVELLGIGSQQVDQLIQVGKHWSLAHKIIGNGWGGNVMFLCQKTKSAKLVDEVIKEFYLSNQNRILLSDDLEQYIHIVQQPSTGLAALNPESQIWY